MCALTSSLLDDSSKTVTWEPGHFFFLGGGGGGSFYPSNTLDRTLTDSRYCEDGRSCFLYKSAPHLSTKCAAEGAHTAFTNQSTLSNCLAW